MGSVLPPECGTDRIAAPPSLGYLNSGGSIVLESLEALAGFILRIVERDNND
jgi:hypothetical protein